MEKEIELGIRKILKFFRPMKFEIFKMEREFVLGKILRSASISRLGKIGVRERIETERNFLIRP